MKNTFLTVLLTLAFIISVTSIYSQNDTGKTKFSFGIQQEKISEEMIDGYILTSYFFSFKTAFTDSLSPFRTKGIPTPADYERILPNPSSYYFTIKDNEELKYNVSLVPRMTDNVIALFYFVTDLNTGKSKKYPCTIPGDIPEKRALEFLGLNVDPEASITGNPGEQIFVFNNKEYEVQSYDKMKNELINILKSVIKKDKAGKKEVVDPESYVRIESIGGKLDFGKSFDSKQIFLGDNKAYTPDEHAKFMWGKGVKKAGITSIDKAIEYGEEIYGEKLNESQRGALIDGFDAK